MRCRIPATALSILLLLLDSATSQDSGVKQNDLAQRVQRLMDVEVGFAQMVPSGMSIEAKEISRKGKSGDDLIEMYHILVIGFPADLLFHLFKWSVYTD